MLNVLIQQKDEEYKLDRFLELESMVVKPVDEAKNMGTKCFYEKYEDKSITYNGNEN